jgi:L-alanine-DL-glutamate epimerase-like enolase superfamily enzyme
MKITGYRTLTTVHDWGRPVGDANGVFQDGLWSVPLILVDTDEGITGVGLGPHLGLSSVFTAIEGEDPRATVALYDRMLRHVFKAGHSGAVFGTIGALDSALWDIKAKDELAEVYRTYAERGLRVAKLKGGLDVGQDLARLTIVRDVLAEANPGSRPGLMLDANEAWSRKQAVRHVAELERTLDLIWVEEPVRRWDADGMVAVGRAVRASIAAGENLTGLEQFRPLLAAGAVDVVQTATGWGVTHFLRVAALAHAFDLPVSPIGTSPAGLLHAATAVPNHMVTELQDLTPAEGLSMDLSIEEGQFVLGDSPGIGVSVDEEAIALLEAPEGVPSRTGPHIRPAQAGRRLDFEPPR